MVVHQADHQEPLLALATASMCTNQTLTFSGTDNPFERERFENRTPLAAAEHHDTHKNLQC